MSREYLGLKKKTRQVYYYAIRERSTVQKEYLNRINIELPNSPNSVKRSPEVRKAINNKSRFVAADQVTEGSTTADLSLGLKMPKTEPLMSGVIS